jgi:hypothetical protein
MRRTGLLAAALAVVLAGGAAADDASGHAPYEAALDRAIGPAGRRRHFASSSGETA